MSRNNVAKLKIHTLVTILDKYNAKHLYFKFYNIYDISKFLFDNKQKKCFT